MNQMDWIAGMIVLAGGMQDEVMKANEMPGSIEVESVAAYGDGSVYIRLISGIFEVAERFGMEVDHWGDILALKIMGVYIIERRENQK